MTLSDFEVTTDLAKLGARGGYLTYHKDNIYFGTYASFTYNCQNFSIAGFEQILLELNNDEVKALVDDLSKEHGRRILLIDVHQTHHARIRNIFNGKTFIVDQPYESTNGSQMQLYYINLSS